MSITTALLRDPNSTPVQGIYNYVNITTQATTLVKSGSGFLHSITFNKPTATGTVELDDAITNTTPVIGTVTTPANPQPVTLFYDVAFSNGLSITTGVANQDITVAYL